MNAHRKSRSLIARAGFTVVEVTVVVMVIAVLAAMMVPTIIGYVNRARVATCMSSLHELAGIMKRFHNDTGFWPYRDHVWSTLPGWTYPQIDPTRATTTDTALYSLPSIPANQNNILSTAGPGMEGPMFQCSQVATGFPCWMSQYASNGNSLGSAQMLDPWGHALMYTLVRPADGWGGGTTYAASGLIMVWSTGPDGIDQTGCTEGAPCAIDWSRLAQGKSSLLPCASGSGTTCSDDIVQFVASAQ